MINGLIIFYNFLGHNFGLSILALTVVVRLITLPLTLRQVRQTKKMSDLAPKLQELQKKHAKDKQRLAQEQMKLYREGGMNPLGCILPMLVQLPIWVALYQSIMRVLASTPEYFLGLSQMLYNWSPVFRAVPLHPGFLWLDLGQPDRFFILPVLVGASTYVQNKMMAMPSVDPRQQSQTQMMNWMMPIMMAWFTISFPSGLGLYWVASNIAAIVIQYSVTGWGTLSVPGILRRQSQPQTQALASPPATVEEPEAPPTEQEKRPDNERRARVQRQNSGGGHRTGSGRARRRQRPDRGGGPKKG